MSVRILVGDAMARLAELPDASIDSCVCDPPYHLTTGKKGGSGSTAIAAQRENFDCIGIEIDPAYAEIARQRVAGDSPLFAQVSVEYPLGSQEGTGADTPAVIAAKPPCEATA